MTYARSTAAGIVISAALVVTGCDVNHNLYEPRDFHAACEDIKAQNASQNLGSFGILRFKPAGLYTMSVPYEAIGLSCNSLCIDMMLRTNKRIVVDVDAQVLSDINRLDSMPGYMKRLHDTGTYEYRLEYFANCKTLYATLAARGVIKDPVAVDGCVYIVKYSDQLPIVDVTENSQVFHGRKGIGETDLEFRRDGRLLGIYKNISYSYPPGPSVQSCIPDALYNEQLQHIIGTS